jgi:predicted nucleic acid-binding protein
VNVVLDADVLIGALDGSDPHHPDARALFRSWHKQHASILISIINLSEVLVAPAAEPDRLRIARSAIAALGVTVHQPTESIGVDAARLRGRHAISLPDGYLLATARQARAVVASFDRKVVRSANAEGIATAAGD